MDSIIEQIEQLMGIKFEEVGTLTKEQLEEAEVLAELGKEYFEQEDEQAMETLEKRHDELWERIYKDNNLDSNALFAVTVDGEIYEKIYPESLVVEMKEEGAMDKDVYPRTYKREE